MKTRTSHSQCAMIVLSLICVFLIKSAFAEHSTLIRSIRSSVDQCHYDHQKICTSCASVGICRLAEGDFEVVSMEECRPGEVCTLEFWEARCYASHLSSSPVCSCDEGKACDVDPFDPSGYVVCGDPISYGSCEESESFDLDTCECQSDCPSCGFSYPGPDTHNCASYYNCGSGTAVGEMCPHGSCFIEDYCQCLESCPPCGYVRDPEDPEGFYFCADGFYEAGKCASEEIFDAHTCKCHPSHTTTPTTIRTTDFTTVVISPEPTILTDHTTSVTIPQETTTASPSPTTVLASTSRKPETEPTAPQTTETETTTTESTTNAFTTTKESTTEFYPTTTPTTTAESTAAPETTTSVDGCNYCGYYSYPNSCSKYYKCLEDGTVEIEECPPLLCFDPVTCVCEL